MVLTQKGCGTLGMMLIHMWPLLGGCESFWLQFTSLGSSLTAFRFPSEPCLSPLALHAHDPVFKQITHSPKVQVS